MKLNESLRLFNMIYARLLNILTFIEIIFELVKCALHLQAYATNEQIHVN